MIMRSDGYCYTYDLCFGKTIGANPLEPLGTRVVTLEKGVTTTQ